MKQTPESRIWAQFIVIFVILVFIPALNEIQAKAEDIDQARINEIAKMLPEKKEDENFMQDVAQVIPKETKRLNKLVTDLLNFASQSAPELRQADLNEKIENVLSLMKKQAEKTTPLLPGLWREWKLKTGLLRM